MVVVEIYKQISIANATSILNTAVAGRFPLEPERVLVALTANVNSTVGAGPVWVSLVIGHLDGASAVYVDGVSGWLRGDGTFGAPTEALRWFGRVKTLSTMQNYIFISARNDTGSTVPVAITLRLEPIE